MKIRDRALFAVATAAIITVATLAHAGVTLRGGGLEKYHVDGLVHSYLSASTIGVTTGSARDSTDSGDIALTSTATITITNAGALGIDSFTSAATMQTVSGNATATASASILTELGAANTAAGSALTFGTSTTTMTFNTDPREFVRVGDLLGTSTSPWGFSRCTALTSTTATLVAALPGGSAPSGLTLQVVRNPSQKIASDTAAGFNTVGADGRQIVLSATAGASASGRALTLGALTASRLYSVWVRSGTSGTTTCISTQGGGGSLPFSITGYNGSYRRVGWVVTDASANLLQWSVVRTTGTNRWINYECALAGAPTAVMDNGTGSTTTWVQVPCATAVPASATAIDFFVTRSGGSSMSMFLRPTATGVSTTTRNLNLPGVTDGLGFNIVVPCDAAQSIDCAQSAGTTGVYIRVAGYMDDLTR